MNLTTFLFIYFSTILGFLTIIVFCYLYIFLIKISIRKSINNLEKHFYINPDGPSKRRGYYQGQLYYWKID